LLYLSGLTALVNVNIEMANQINEGVNVNMIEMANQIKEGGSYYHNVNATRVRGKISGQLFNRLGKS
ncbi:MAG: hypothetical protein ACRCW3_03605, partial [Metamycoplasmataceae bacterium]